MTEGSYMAGAMPEHDPLTLDCWQDSVSYEGKLAQTSQPLREIVQAIGFTKIITLAEELPTTLLNYKRGIMALEDELYKGE